MQLSIVILNYNSKDFLLPCIQGIVKHTQSLDFEIIIVDNKSSDTSVAYIKEKILPRFKQVRLIEAPHNKGYAYGNNLGIQEARGEYVLIMNPDIVIWENALTRMVAYMDAHPRVGIAGPRLLSPDGSLQYFCYRFPSPEVFLYRRTPLARFSFAQKVIQKYLMMDWDHKDTRAVDWIQGSCMIVRKQAIEEVGLMDERYFLFLEDTDWCRRFWKKGWEIHYIADIEIIHYHSRASATTRFYQVVFNRMTWVHITSAIKYFKKWGIAVPHFSQ